MNKISYKNLLLVCAISLTATISLSSLNKSFAVNITNTNTNKPKLASGVLSKARPYVKKISTKKAEAEKEKIALNRLNSLLKQNSKFQAKVSQRNLTQEGEVKSSGLIKIEQPNHFYYEIKKPNEVLYVSDGKTLWQYDKALMQVIKKKIDMSITISKVPLLILTNPNKNILKYFVVKEVQPNIFILTTIHKDDFIHQVLIGFDNDKAGKINQFQVLNTLHQKTEILFSDVEFVKAFEPGMFEFKAPKGVDVLG